MGGTTAKCCLIDDGEPLVAPRFEVNRVYRFKKGSGSAVRVPVIDLIEIGAGGGTIARDRFARPAEGRARQRRRDPGPACYGRGGTQPTVTDADLLLGYLDPAFFLGGRMTLDLAAAEHAVAVTSATRLGMTRSKPRWASTKSSTSRWRGRRECTRSKAARTRAIPRLRVRRRWSGPRLSRGGDSALAAIDRALGAGVASDDRIPGAPLAFDFVRSYVGGLDALDLERGQRHASTRWNARAARSWLRPASIRTRSK